MSKTRNPYEGPLPIHLNELIPNQSNIAQQRKHTRIFFANITSWSKMAQNFFSRNAYQYQVIGLAETHTKAEKIRSTRGWWKQQGFKTSQRPAVLTGRSVAGTSGGVLMGIHGQLASSSLEQLDNHPNITTPTNERYWVGRYLRTNSRNVLMITVYMPPGSEYVRERRETLQEIGLIVSQNRGPYLIVGDWNAKPQELIESGFPAFIQ